MNIRSAIHVIEDKLRIASSKRLADARKLGGD